MDARPKGSWPGVLVLLVFALLQVSCAEAVGILQTGQEHRAVKQTWAWATCSVSAVGEGSDFAHFAANWGDRPTPSYG